MDFSLNNPQQTKLALGLGLACLTLAAPSAEAALSSYSSSATLTYTINSIVNTTNPGNLADLLIEGSFAQQGAPASFAILTGDGSVTASNPTFGPASVSSPWSYSFSTSGAAANGTVDASHLGWFALDFTNQGSDVFNISVTLGYQLDAGASGQSAASSVHLDYFNGASTFSGFADALAFAPGSPTGSTSGSSGVFNFTLSALGTESLLGDVTITGNLQATTPVPLPPAIWAFLTGCATFCRFAAGRQRRHS